jgi:hypothetical protein
MQVSLEDAEERRKLAKPLAEQTPQEIVQVDALPG